MKIKFSHLVIVKAPGLLPMFYKISELSIELNTPDRTIRDWIAMGAPHIYDEHNRLWVNGVEFAGWIKAQRPKCLPKNLPGGDAWCFRCKKPVQIMDAHYVSFKGKLQLLRGRCGECGTVVNRGSKRL